MKLQQELDPITLQVSAMVIDFEGATVLINKNQYAIEFLQNDYNIKTCPEWIVKNCLIRPKDVGEEKTRSSKIVEEFRRIWFSIKRRLRRLDSHIIEIEEG